MEQAARLEKFSFKPLEPVFPAVTCTAQASFRTAAAPSVHGMVSNGLFFADLKKVMFWEQASSLVEGGRIWDGFRKRGGRVGMIFWQQSLGESVDLVLSPAPIHKHGGGMIQDCYSRPDGLYRRLAGKIGRPFNLMNYWGPLASRRSSDWIADATFSIMEGRDAPDVLFSYLPHLDYDLQRHGPDSAAARRAVDVLGEYLGRLREHAKAHEYDYVVFGDYAIEAVTQPAIFPNRRLRERGLFATRSIKEMSYPDFFSSRAFAVADHQVAHVYAAPDAVAEAAEALRDLPGVEALLDRAAQKSAGVDHPRGGDLIAVARPGAWFAYPWWEGKNAAPDFASHVDIHNKPGYDPCELFFGWPPLRVSSDVARVRGTHGRAGGKTGWTASLDLGTPATLLELARAIRERLDSA